MQYEVCGTAHCNTNFSKFSVLYRISFGTNDAVAIIRLKEICTHINFLQAISQSDFVVSMVVLKEVSSLILPATRAFQTLGLDVVVAMHTIGDLTKASAGMRCEEVFTNIFTAAENVANRGGVEDTRLEAKAKAKDTKKNRGQGQGQPFRGQTLSRPRTGMLEAKAKDQGHKRKCSPKSQKFFRRSPKKKRSSQKIVLSSSRGQANFRGLEASRPRPRTSKCVLEAKDVLEDSTSGS